MSKTACLIIGFVAGGVAGVFAARSYFKNKYEEIANEEIREAIKDCKSKLKKHHVITDDENIPARPDVEIEDEIDTKDFETNPARTKYTKYFDNVNAPKPEPATEVADPKPEPTELLPRIISEDEYGELTNYDQQTLYYFNDEVLADENGEIIEKGSIPRLVGTEFSSHFGEFADDAVFVRNDRLQIDYEILLSMKDYKDEYPSDEDDS